MKRAGLLVVLILIAACGKRAGESGSDGGSIGPPASATAGNSATSTGPLIDAATVGTCQAAYNCGLSHPGLGSSFNETAVDFATCSKITTSQSGPWESQPAAPGAPDPVKKSRSEAKVSPAECSRIQKLVTAITPKDVSDASEAAHVDTTACTLSVTCADPTRAIRVQRQTTTGAGRVVELIRAVQTAH